MDYTLKVNLAGATIIAGKHAAVECSPGDEEKVRRGVYGYLVEAAGESVAHRLCNTHLEITPVEPGPA